MKSSEAEIATREQPTIPGLGIVLIEPKRRPHVALTTDEITMITTGKPADRPIGRRGAAGQA